MEMLVLVFLAALQFTFATKLPSGMSEHQYCEGCISTVKELSKKLTRKTDSRDLLVMDSMERICNPQNFVSYEYSPPRTVKACKLLLERHEETIETFLIKDGKDAENMICFDISGACTGVNRNEKPKDYGDIDLTNNGKGKDKFSKVVDIDPVTGKTRINEGMSDGSTPLEEGDEVKKSKPQRRGAGKTLSKKDKKKKSEKKSKAEKKKEQKVKAKDAKQQEKKKAGGVDFLNVDINDPNSIKNVLNQINQIKQDHEKKFNEKLEKEENQKDEL